MAVLETLGLLTGNIAVSSGELALYRAVPYWKQDCFTNKDMIQ